MWDTYKAFLRGVLIAISCSQAKKVQEETKTLENEIHRLHEILEREHGNPNILSKLTTAKHKLADFLEIIIKKKWDASKLAHHEYGEGCSKLLAWKTKIYQTRNWIKDLRCLDTGSIITDDVKIEEAFVQFLTNLYTEEMTIAENSMDEFLSEIALPSLQQNEKEQINRPISMEEITQTISSLKKGKAAGPDSIPSEIYSLLKEELTPILLQLFN